MSFFSDTAYVGQDSLLYLVFASPVNPLADSDRNQTSRLRARLVPVENVIFIDIRMRVDIAHIPTMLISNVVDHDCHIGANTTPYLSQPTRREEYDFAISFEPNDGSTLVANGEKRFLTAYVTKSGDYNKESNREIRVFCRSTLVPHKETFTDRRLAVWTMPAGMYRINEGLPIASRQRYTVDFSSFAGREGFRVSGGNPIVSDTEVNESESRSLPGQSWPDEVVVVWRDTRYALLRDVALILSGTMLGFSGVFFVELRRTQAETRA